MKKMIALALGALLVIAFTAPVMAETKVDFSGSYRVRAFYKNNIGFMSDESDDEDKNSYFDHRLRIDVKFMPSDSLAMNIGLNLDGNKWGTQDWGYDYQRAYASGRTAPVGDDDSAAFFEVRYYWMSFTTNVGAFHIGRQAGGAAGLSALGWMGNEWHGADFADTVAPADRIKWVYANGPFSLVAIYEKVLEVDNVTGSTAEPAQEYDADWNVYILDAGYKWANGGAKVGWLHSDNRSDTANPVAGGRWTAVMGALIGTNPDYVNYQTDLIAPAAVMNFGPFGIHFEGGWQFGTADLTWNPTAKPAGAKSSYDVSGWRAYLDATYNYGPGLVGVEFAYLSGDDNTTDDDLQGSLRSGGDYTPYLVAFDGPAATWAASAGQPAAQGILDASNYWLLGAWVDHSLTEDLMLHAAFGYFSIVNAGKYLNTSGEWVEIDEHFGHEFDIGLQVNIMPNLKFITDFGYFWSGAYFEGGRTATDDAVNGTTFADHGNAYMWKNTLQLSF